MTVVYRVKNSEQDEFLKDIRVNVCDPDTKEKQNILSVKLSKYNKTENYIKDA